MTTCIAPPSSAFSSFHIIPYCVAFSLAKQASRLA
jgi:hypothetical protein